MAAVKTDISPLIYLLDSFHPQSEAVREYLCEHVKAFRFSKGDLLLMAGDICEYIYFVKQGVVRGFVMDRNKDITTWITAEYEMVTSISAFALTKPAIESIEAIEDCELLGLKIVEMDQLYLLHPEFNITGRKLLQQYYRDAEQRALLVRFITKEQRYLFFLEQYAHLANRIPLKYIASYLGMTIETLSRVRKKISL